ncbi:hypothetical protein [Donghicola tyrosinivorans]|uniref:hypothetical protein n=1 Tax=Donghicola tyrosinivorans TaxID=1652492 RepID=UPI0011B1E43B|nr:hypothetical protein [Donghicola tyrosinivorans]
MPVTMSNSRQGRYGEARFAELCQNPSAGVEAVVNKASDDEHGWDHVVDLVPYAMKHKPADLADHLVQCFAQIKTTRGEKVAARIKLSNALKAAKSPNPSFVFLFHQYSEHEVPVLYGRHIWEDEINWILEKAREVSVKEPQKPLHKVFLNLRFGQGDMVDGHPSDWMFKAVERLGAGRYSKAKIKVVETVGYEPFSHLGKLQFPTGTSLRDLVSHQLGMIDDLPVSRVQFFDRRFGIEVQTSDELGGGRIEISGREMPATLRLVSSDGRAIEIPAIVLTPSFLEVDDPEFRLRVDAGGINIFQSVGDQRQEFNYKLDVNQPRNLRQLIGLMCLLDWGVDDGVKFEVYIEEGEILSGEVTGLPPVESWVHMQAVAGLHILDIIGPGKCDKVEISHVEFNKCVKDMYFVASIVGAGSFNFQGVFAREIENFSGLLGYSFTEVGGWCIGAIYQFECKARGGADDMQVFYFSNSRILKRFSFRQPIEVFKKLVVLEFEKVRANLSDPHAVLLNGNFSELGCAVNEGRDISLDIR